MDGGLFLKTEAEVDARIVLREWFQLALFVFARSRGDGGGLFR